MIIGRLIPAGTGFRVQAAKEAIEEVAEVVAPEDVPVVPTEEE